MILFLAHAMKRGHGVAVVIENTTQVLAGMGIPVVVGCVEHDTTMPDLDIRTVAPDPASVTRLADEVGAVAIVAQTTPYFEVLPHLPKRFKRWAWEHGDPSPTFFEHDRKQRERIIQHKIDNVYPNIDGVIAISDFIRSDIRWPNAHIIGNGCDHIPDLGPKGLQDFPLGDSQPLRVGALMRLGMGEARYKGNSLYLRLAQSFQSSGRRIEFQLMGTGTAEDEEPYRAAGIKVFLNATDEQRADYLRGLDVLVSPSLWEGCNLPLLEAQASGTAAIAFDIGAHPEVTPLLVGGLDELRQILLAYEERRDLVRQHSALCHRFVRRRFRWRNTAEAAARIILDMSADGVRRDAAYRGDAGPEKRVLRDLLNASGAALNTIQRRMVPLECGYVEDVKAAGSVLVVQGWAVDWFAERPAEAVLILHGDKIIGFCTPDMERPDLVHTYGLPNLLKSGFKASIDRKVLSHLDSGSIRAFCQLGEHGYAELPRR